MINLYDAKCTDFNNNGLVVLSDCKSCFVEEKLNDSYECTLEYPIDEHGKWSYLTEGNIIKADGQLFRIYHKVKTLDGIQINARHIFYDLLDNFLEDVRPTNLTGLGALDWILTHTQYPHNFTCTGDVAGSANADYVRKNVVEAIMSSETSDSQQNSLLVNYGGELVRDNFTIQYLQARGKDRGVLVSYGKNIVGIEETLDTDNVVTRVMPVGKDGLLLPEKYVDSPLINNYPHPKINTIEFSDIDNVDALRTAATAWINNNDKPTVNYSIDFIELSKTEEYKNYKVLETVYMGDIVTIKHSRLNIDLKAKVIRIKKNIITDRIEEVELGSFKPDLSNAFTGVQASINAITNTQKDLQDQVDGKIETYFQGTDPNTWSVSDRQSHDGDIWFYKTADGVANLKRYDSSKNEWISIGDEKAIAAYDAASKAQDTADGKRRIFTSTPVPPYDVGDLWAQGKTGEIMRCMTAKIAGQSYNASDFELASKYTDDSKVTEFITGVYATDKNNLQNQIDGAIDTWFYAGMPTLSNAPANTWTDNATKDNHIGDLYYDTDSSTQTTKHAYRFALVSGVYQWLLITDTDVTKALANAQTAQDTADHKRRVFVATPTVPYDIGDLWMQGTTGDILTCQTGKALGQTYSSSDFVKLNKYTDDTAVNNLQIGGVNLIKNTDFSNLDATVYSVRDSIYTLSVDSTNQYKGRNSLKIIGSSAGSPGHDIQVHTTVIADTAKQYIISFYAKANSTTNLTVRWGWSSNNQIVIGTSWQYYSIAVPTTGIDSNQAGAIYLMFDNANTIWLNSVMFEEGQKATSWRLAPEDVQANIDTAQKAADDAQTSANNAQTDATKAINTLDDIANDSKLTASEKQSVQQTWNAIQSEKSTIDGQADHYGISKTAYDNAYVTLQSYITPLLSDMTTTSTIDKNTFNNDFVSYYNAKNALLQAIVQKAKDNLDNLQIGGRNLLLNSGWQKDTSHWNIAYPGLMQRDTSVTLDGQNTIKCVASGNTSEKDFWMTHVLVPAKSGDIFTASIYVMAQDITTIDGAKLYLEINYKDANGNILNYSGNSHFCPSQNNSWERFTTTITAPANTAYAVFAFYLGQNGTLWLAKPKLERGQKATDWTSAIEDTQSQIDNLNTFVNTTYQTDQTNMQKAISDATDTISGNKGGYILVKKDANGKPTEILVMDTEDINTAKSVWRWNNSGLGHSATGYNGSYTTAITADGKLVVSSATVDIIVASLIKGGILKSLNNLSWINLDSGELNFGNKLTFDGSELSVIGDFITYTSSQKAIELVKETMNFYDWEGTTRTDPVSCMFSGRRILGNAVSSIPGSVIANERNAYLSLSYKNSSGDYTDYVLLDKDGVAQMGADFPIWVKENIIVNSILGIRNPSAGNYNRIWNSDNDRMVIEISTANQGSGYQIQSNTGTSLWGIFAGQDYPIENNNHTKVYGNFTVTGSKNSLQKTEHYGERLINAYETAEYYFGDIGQGIINKDGECVVYIDEIFQECINLNMKYHVFAQVYNGEITKIERYTNYFIVKGEPDTEFSWELKAKRKNFENVRIEQPFNPSIPQPISFDEELKSDDSLNKIYDTVLDNDLVNQLLEV